MKRSASWLGCLGLLCFPVAIVLTIRWMAHKEQIALYVGSGAVAALGILLLLLWLGWWLRQLLPAFPGRKTLPERSLAKPEEQQQCSVCREKPADWFCSRHVVACCQSCAEKHKAAGDCRFWINPYSEAMRSAIVAAVEKAKQNA